MWSSPRSAWRRRARERRSKVTGKETKTGPEPKKIRESIKHLHAAGFDLGPDYANTMVTWVGPGTSQDSQDPYTSARLMNEKQERPFRQALSMMGVLLLSWSVTRTLFPQMGNWYETGIFVTPGRSGPPLILPQGVVLVQFMVLLDAYVLTVRSRLGESPGGRRNAFNCTALHHLQMYKGHAAPYTGKTKLTTREEVQTTA